MGMSAGSLYRVFLWEGFYYGISAAVIGCITGYIGTVFVEAGAADALRLTLITGNAPGNDMRFYYDRVENSRNFANKVWNASRFIMMNLEDQKVAEADPAALTAADRWILSRVNRLAKK